MKRIVILTSTRAEYGLLKPIMIGLLSDKSFDVRIAVTGMHLSHEFGMTVNEIVSDGLYIDKKIEILLSSDTPIAVSKAMGLAMISFSEYFEECNPDALIVLGDRFETFAVCAAATNARIPIFHLHGGEATEGLIDEAYRHSITKMSYLHFTSTETYRKRVIQMGESPDRVFNVGAIGVENALNVPVMSLAEIETSLGFKLTGKYAIGTFHPVTLENSTAEQQTIELLAALDNYSDINFLFTKANADTDGLIINSLLNNYSYEHDNFHLVDSLGMYRYLNVVRNACFVIGNSSSGIIEVPSFHVPTINIGDRQKGRITGDSIISCNPDRVSINNSINLALSDSFRDKIKNSINPYGDGKTSLKVIKIIKSFFNSDNLNIKKRFYDLNIEE